jgi:hypothetical protein
MIYGKMWLPSVQKNLYLGKECAHLHRLCQITISSCLHDSIPVLSGIITGEGQNLYG